MQAGHLGGGAGFVDEDQPGWIEIGLAFEPSQASASDVRAILLGGVRGFFEADVAAIEEPSQGADPDGHTTLAQHRLQLGQRHIRCLLDPGQQKGRLRLDPIRPPVAALSQGRRAAAATPLIHPPDRARHTDPEPLSSLAPRQSVLNRPHHTNTKIL